MNDVVGRVGGRSEPTVGGTVAASWNGLGDVRYFAFVVKGDEDGSGIMKSCFVIIVVNDVVGQCRGAIRTDCWRNRSCLVDSIGDVRCFAVVVQGDEDGSGVMMELLRCHRGERRWWARVVGRSEPTVGETVAASWTDLGTSGTLPSSCRATRTAAVS